MLWIDPVCDKNCSVTVNLNDLTLEQLLKINEYREIRSSVEEFYYEEEDKKAGQSKKP